MDRLAKRQDVRFQTGEGPYRIARTVLGEPVLMAKPSTFMNRSGVAVADLVNRYELPHDRIVVVCDDLNLPLGKLRLRTGGRSGGHQGLASIVHQLQSTAFPRLRLGIGPPAAPAETVEFVLSPFLPHERHAVRGMVERAVEALVSVAKQGLPAAMNAWNVDYSKNCYFQVSRSSVNDNPCSRDTHGGNQKTEGR